jgi:thiamine monophosphate synthase
LDLIRKVRPLTDKPIVAIGGITLERAAAAIEAGADSVAVISGILSAPDPGRSARHYIEALASAKRTAAV